MNIPKEIRDKAVDYSFDSIKYICDEIGPRESGMPAERKAQEWLKDQLLENGWADEAEIEPFTVSRHGLVGFTKIVSVLLVIAAAVQFAAYFAGGAANAAANAVTGSSPTIRQRQSSSAPSLSPVFLFFVFMINCLWLIFCSYYNFVILCSEF